MTQPTCHPARPHKAKGLCEDCYYSEYHAKRRRVSAEMAVAWPAAFRHARAEQDLTWQDDAYCAGAPHHIFFPEKANPTIYDEARQICARCPVNAECLEFGLEDRWGI